MLSNITFGQYYPAASPIHKMDGRVKILLTLAFLVFIFVASNAASLIFLAVVLFCILLLSGVPIKQYLRNIKSIIPIIILTSILNVFYTSGGTLVFSVWKIHIYSQGIITAVYIASRIVLLIICSTVMTYTTTPTDLTDSIEKLLSPLKLFKIDTHTPAMMMSIALRFVPTLIEETQKIMAAQKSRGADVENGGIVSRIKALIPIIIPLLISSFRRALELADAMECRCYHGGMGRTRLKQMKLAKYDLFAVLFFVAVLGALIYTVRNLDGAVYTAFMSVLSLIKGII